MTLFQQVVLKKQMLASSGKILGYTLNNKWQDAERLSNCFSTMIPYIEHSPTDFLHDIHFLKIFTRVMG